MNGNGTGHAARDATRADAQLRRRERNRTLRSWLRPGIGIKRWLLFAFFGLLLIALAAALLLRAAFENEPAPDPTQPLDTLSVTLEMIVVVLFTIGLAIFAYGAWRLLRALVEPYQVGPEPLGEMLYQRRLRARGPRIVAIGGGTGLSVLLRGLKEQTSNITAVVTVADDGGSSGKLRNEMGMPPMGDIRNCIAALADAEPAMSSLLQYRFPTSNGAESSFAGHAFGNLLIAALTNVTGNFEEGVRQSNRVLAVRGSVVPVAGEPINLHAELGDGSTLLGQSRIARARWIRRVWIKPDNIEPSEEALEAIATADLVVIGPGSVYTSLLPPLLVPGIADALRRSGAARLFVCNVATQVGESEEFNVSDHLAALSAHGLADVIDGVLVNSNFAARQPANYPAAPVVVDVSLSRADGPPIFARDVVDDDNAHHHDPRKLATAIFALHDERVLSRRERVALS